MEIAQLILWIDDAPLPPFEETYGVVFLKTGCTIDFPWWINKWQVTDLGYNVNILQPKDNGYEDYQGNEWYFGYYGEANSIKDAQIVLPRPSRTIVIGNPLSKIMHGVRIALVGGRWNEDLASPLLDSIKLEDQEIEVQGEDCLSDLLLLQFFGKNENGN